jgi:hypothetical protein
MAIAPVEHVANGLKDLAQFHKLLRVLGSNGGQGLQ